MCLSVEPYFLSDGLHAFSFMSCKICVWTNLLASVQKTTMCANIVSVFLFLLSFLCSLVFLWFQVSIPLLGLFIRVCFGHVVVFWNFWYIIFAKICNRCRGYFYEKIKYLSMAKFCEIERCFPISHDISHPFAHGKFRCADMAIISLCNRTTQRAESFEILNMFFSKDIWFFLDAWQLMWASHGNCSVNYMATILPTVITFQIL